MKSFSEFQEEVNKKVPPVTGLGGGGGGRHLVYAHCDSSLHVNIFQVIDASLRERAHGAYRRLILGSIF